MRTERRTHQQAVIVVDGRPQGVGRQPVSQNEAQGNRSEMNALEDGQTTTSNTQRAEGERHCCPQCCVQATAFERKNLDGQHFLLLTAPRSTSLRKSVVLRERKNLQNKTAGQ